MIKTNFSLKTKLFSDKKSIFKFVGFLVVLIGTIFALINTYFPKMTLTGHGSDAINTKDVGDATFNWISYFTTESNLLVMLSFFILWIRSDLEGKNKTVGSFNMTLCIAVYITITFLVYNLILLPTGQPGTPLGWVETIILHMISPVLYIVYFILFFEQKNQIQLKGFLRKDLYKIYIYPLVYFVFVELRGLSRRYSGVPTKENSPYLYFFLNPFKELPLLIGVFFGILIIASLIAVGYTAAINKRIIKSIQKRENLETKTI